MLKLKWLILSVLVIGTIVLSYFIQEWGTWDIIPTTGSKILVTFCIAYLISSITVIPFIIWIRSR